MRKPRFRYTSKGWFEVFRRVHGQWALGMIPQVREFAFGPYATLEEAYHNRMPPVATFEGYPALPGESAGEYSLRMALLFGVSVGVRPRFPSQ